MYKRTKKALINSTPPNMEEGERCIVDTERGKAAYFTEYAPCIHTRIGGSGATVVLIKRKINETNKSR